MSSKITFRLPPPSGFLDEPRWDGEKFILENFSTPVLEYSENFEGWSDDLTTLHEDAAGDSHPIDKASRTTALNSIENLDQPTGSVILEVGCSSGYLIKELVERFPNSNIVGADVVKAPLFELARAFPGIPLIRFDLLNCPLPEKTFDAIIMLNVLEHIEDDLLALKNVRNLLKPGGYLILEVPAGPRLYDRYDEELRHFRRYSSTNLIEKLQLTGFKVVNQSHLGFLLFPFFALVKFINKFKASSNTSSTVQTQASQTSNSHLIDLIMKFELKFLSKITLPFGIRVLAVARRPE